jgi:hypothetical protein
MISNLFNIDHNFYEYESIGKEILPLRSLSKDIIDYVDQIKNNVNNLNKFHNDIQNYLHELSKKYNYISKKEYSIKDIPNFRGKYGLIDIVWYNSNKSIAIEIDSCARVKSIIKLLNSNMDIKLWVIYGNEKCKQKLEELDENGEIIYIDLGNLKTNIKKEMKKKKLK